MSDSTRRAVLYLIASATKEAVEHWEYTLLGALLIKEFGKSGAKFVGGALWEIKKAQVMTTIRIAKLFGRTLGPDIMRKTGMTALITTGRAAVFPTAAGLSLVAGTAALAYGPELTKDFLSDESNYPTNEAGGIGIPFFILDGGITN